MRRASIAVLAVVVVALAVAGVATTARFGLFQAGGSAPQAPLDPAALGASATPAQPLPSGLCPPQAEPAGASGSDASFQGPCPFHQAGRVFCRAAGDDFYLLLRRTLASGASLTLYGDVEFYHGPRTYQEVQLLLLVQDGATIYQWSNFRARATVAPAEAALRLPPTRLGVEAGNAGSGIETVAGSLGCGAAA